MEQTMERMHSILTGHMQKRISNIQGSLTRIQNETSLINDSIAPANTFMFEPQNNGILLSFQGLIKADPMMMSKNAIRQLAGSADINVGYMNTLIDSGTPWKTQLASTILNEHSSHMRSRHLIREVMGEAKAVLSDRYKRLDSTSIYSTFIQGVNTTGAKIVDASFDGFKGYMEAILP
jgi:hypothetical protein